LRYRIILRVSLNGDVGSVVRNTALAPILTQAGLQNTATGTWESANCDLDTAVSGMSNLFGELEGLDDAASAHLDHIWIYIDRAEAE
jgi:hypothetical protein